MFRSLQRSRPVVRHLLRLNSTTPDLSRDHRTISQTQQLFIQHPMAVGSPFFMPHGTRILSKLQDFLRTEYRKRGYDEVETPQIFSRELWQTSGHWQHYRKDMFGVTCGAHHHDPTESNPVAEGSTTGKTAEEVEEESLALKPMNCPAHCLMFGSHPHSYRDLPIRVADFGALHRNEARGALGGLTRLRRFHQDDAHIFCTQEQLKDEIIGCLKFIEYVYGVFGLKYEVKLSTRPTEGMLGSAEDWDIAENCLTQALESVNLKWTLNSGDGAFYAPKIDISVYDSQGRSFQCATVQADFQLPRRFNLSFAGADGTDKQPVIIHRAILGSLERFMAILIEHTAGKWPLWLSPRQVVVCTIADRHAEYANAVSQELRNAGFYSDVNPHQDRVQKKIRDAQVLQYNYILVVGDKDQSNNVVTVRTREGVVLPAMTTADLLGRMRQEVIEFK